MKIRTYITFILLFVSFLAFGSIQASAQQLTLSITPPLVESVIKPGKSILVGYTISNLGDPVILSSHVRPFEPEGVNGNLIISEEFEGPIRFNLENSNIALSDEFFLQSNEGQQLLLKIRVPEGTPEGDYYYTFYVQNDLGKRIEGTDAAQNLALVGSNILITVTESGNVDIGGSIGQFGIRPWKELSLFGSKVAIFESTDLVPVELLLQNTGRNLVKPHGTITLNGTLGERAEYSILEQNILAQSSRMVVATPSATLTPDEQATQKPASLFLSGFFVGKYTLFADVDFGPGTESHKASVVFYALPFKFMLATLTAILFAIVIVRKFRQSEPEY